MKLRGLAFLIALLASGVASADNQVIEVVTQNEGRSPLNYVSTHRFECSDHTFDLKLSSPDPVRAIRLKRDGRSISRDLLAKINAAFPGRSTFDAVTASCSPQRQVVSFAFFTATEKLSLSLTFMEGRQPELEEVTKITGTSLEM